MRIPVLEDEILVEPITDVGFVVFGFACHWLEAGPVGHRHPGSEKGGE